MLCIRNMRVDYTLFLFRVQVSFYHFQKNFWAQKSRGAFFPGCAVFCYLSRGKMNKEIIVPAHPVLCL